MSEWKNIILSQVQWDGVSHMIFMQLIKVICLLITIAYFTLAERKVMAAIQRRKGPNYVGLFGLLQPIADGVKLIVKELIIPTKSNSYIFLIAPILILTLSFINWSIIPSNISLSNLDIAVQTTTRYTHVTSSADIPYSLLMILAISGFNAYGIIIAGWSSNSKYAFLGALRSAAQMISYEVSLSLLILPVVLLAGSLNFTDIVMAQALTGWFVLPLLPCVIMFFISMLAETNRAPFDLPEAEAELVAGYNVEYSSIIFAMFFLGEYTNMLLMSTIIVLLFFGGWLPLVYTFGSVSNIWFSLKIIIFCFFYILVRATLPRYRYDQLMEIGWKLFLPLSLGYLLLIVSFLLITNSLPEVFEILPQNYSENVYL